MSLLLKLKYMNENLYLYMLVILYLKNFLKATFIHYSLMKTKLKKHKSTNALISIGPGRVANCPVRAMYLFGHVYNRNVPRTFYYAYKNGPGKFLR